ncbi:hypothetical protein RB595_006825 [Gaeumannomyces hyphopodioides]
MEAFDAIQPLIPSSANDGPNTTAVAVIPLADLPITASNTNFAEMASRLPPTFKIERLSSEDSGPAVKTGMWTLVAVSGLFLALRLSAKKKKRHISALDDDDDAAPGKQRRRRSLYWDDWALVGAWVALLANGIFTHAAVELGYGRHAGAVDARALPSLAVAGLLSSTFSVAGQAWSKTGFALTLLRFTRRGGRARAFVLVNVVLANVLFAVGALLFWVQCVPLERLWRPLLAEGRCLDPRINVVYGIIVGGYSGIMDLVLSALPWKVLKDVQIDQQEKIAMILAMNMGIFAGIAAFIKCSYMPTLIHGDFSYNGAQLVIWGAAETAVVIMATSIPIMRPLIRDAASSMRKKLAPKNPQQRPGALPSDQKRGGTSFSAGPVCQAPKA